MNRFLRVALLAIALPALLCTGCGRRENEGVVMLARISAVGEKIEVEVLESEYTSGPHWIITHEKTVYESSRGKKLDREDIKVGDTVEIYYNGQVMLSYPPQIVAHRIIKK